MSVENRTTRTSNLRGPVTDIPGLTTYLAATYLPLADFAEAVDDEVATLLQAGTDVTVTYNDAANTLTVGLGANVPRLNAANTWTQTNTFSGTIVVGTGVSIVRNATGPTAETRAAGGLRVCNADGSALGPVACSTITTSGTATVANVDAGGGAFFVSSATGRTTLYNAGVLGWTNAGTANTAIVSNINQLSAGVLQIGTTSNNALGSLNLANLTASGGITFGPRTRAALLATSATATAGCWRITDSTPAQRIAYPDGTNWRYLSDDTVVT